MLPLQLAAVLNQYDDSLYQFTHSLAHQLRRRYFRLHDLDFSPVAIQAVKGFPSMISRRDDSTGSDGTSGPNYIMSIRITPDGAEPPEPFAPNSDVYGLME